MPPVERSKLAASPSGTHSAVSTPGDGICHQVLAAIRAMAIRRDNRELRGRVITLLFEELSTCLSSSTTVSIDLSEGGVLRLTEHPTDFVAGGEVGEWLESQGLRRVTFHRGLTPDHLEIVLRILASGHDTGDPIANHVRIRSWEALPEKTELSFSPASDPQIEKFFGNLQLEDTLLLDRFLPYWPGSSAPDTASFGITNPVQLLTNASPEAGAAPFELNELLTLTDQDRALVSEEVDLTNAQDVASAPLVSAVFEVVRQTGPDPELFSGLTDVLTTYIRQTDITSVVAMLYPLRLLATDEFAPGFAARAQVVELFEYAARPKTLDLLRQALLDPAVNILPDALFAYTSLLLPSSAVQVYKFLEDIPSALLRRAASDGALCALELDLEPLKRVMLTLRDDLALELLESLERLEHRDVLDIVLLTFGHRDASVRRAVVGALHGFESPRARDLCVHGLNDPDEEVRLAAMRSLAAHRNRQGGLAITEKIRDKTFEEAAFPEKRALCMSLGHIFGAECQVFLFERFFQTRNTEAQRAVLYGLGVIGGPEVVQWLTELQPTAHPDVKSDIVRILGMFH